MKQIALFIGLIVVISLTSCTEKGPLIDFSVKSLEDTTYIDMNLPAPQLKGVILEEFTGVKCNNCPKGHKKAEEIHTTYGERFVTVGIHNSSNLARPYKTIDGAQDFRTDEGFAISTELGGNLAIPTGSIDRKVFDGELSKAVSVNSWEAYVEQRLSIPNVVNISGQINEDEAIDSQYIAEVSLHILDDLPEEAKLHVFLIENNIINPQLLLDNSVDTFYNHKHIFRTTLTPVIGSDFIEGKEQGRVIKRFYSIIPQEKWNMENIELVVFVEDKDGVIHVKSFKD